MINGVSNSFSSMSMTGVRSIQKPPPPPPEKDVFKAADSDGNGTVSATELEPLLEDISEVNGELISVEDAINNYDSDKDGALSGEELLGLMTDSGFLLPEPPESEGGQRGKFPSVQNSSEVAAASYAQNSGHDSIAHLLELLQSSRDESETSTSLDITT